MARRMRQLPEDLFADTGMPGDLSATAAPTGTETQTGPDPLAGMVPPAGPNEGGIGAMLNPGGGSLPTSGPNLGADLSAAISQNPGDAALAAQGGDQMGGDPMGGMGGDPAQQDADIMLAQLNDPSTPPDVKNQIMQQMQLAARRKLAGV